jgi:ribonuclease E
LVSETPEVEPEEISLEAGLSRLLEHLAETPAVGKKAEPVVVAGEKTATREAPPTLAAPEPAAEKEVKAAPPARPSGLLGKIRREMKTAAPASEAGEGASPVAQVGSEASGDEAPPRRKSGPFGREARPKLKKGTGEIAEPVADAAAEPIAEAPAAPRRKSGPLGREGPSGLLRKVRGVQKAPTGPIAPKEPAAAADAMEQAPPAEAQAGELEDQDISRLLDAVREAAEGTGTGEPPKFEAAPARPPEEEEPPPTPPSSRRPPVWPPPRPSETDEE